MYLPITLSDGSPAKIIVRHTTDVRLSATCFRGISLACAGNFSRFSRVREVFQEKALLEGLIRHASASVKELEETPDAHVATFSCTVDMGRAVGWESTSALSRHRDDELEPFNPNRRSHALRVKPERTDIRAPRTRLITVVFQVRREPDAWAIIIHSMYPGRDIGDLKGNVTKREQRVFFSWEHPGA